MNFQEIDRLLHLSPVELAQIAQPELFSIVREMRSLLYDPLTGLRDRRQFSEGLELLMRNNTAFALFDVDDFGNLNDTYGYNFGDRVLAGVGEIIGNSSRCAKKRKSDTIRYGGEEFLVVLPETGIYEAESYANRIITQVRQRDFYTEGGQRVPVTMSAGVSHFDEEYDLKKDKTQMVLEAGLALHISKASGKDKVSPFRWPQLSESQSFQSDQAS